MDKGHASRNMAANGKANDSVVGENDDSFWVILLVSLLCFSTFSDKLLSRCPYNVGNRDTKTQIRGISINHSELIVYVIYCLKVVI